MLAGTTCVAELSIFEAEICITPFLKNSDERLSFSFDNENLSVFAINDNTELIIFCRDSQHLDSYLIDCQKSVKQCGLTLTYNISDGMSFADFSERCSIRGVAHQLAEVLISGDPNKINSLVSKIDVDLSASKTKHLLSITESILAASEDGQAEKLGETTLAAFTENYLNERSKRRLSDAVKQYIYVNYSNPSLSVSSIANHFNMNSNYVGIRFRQECGLSIPCFLNEFRIQKAKELFENNIFITIDQVSEQVGFQVVTYFCKVFKNLTGTTPSTYHRSVQKNEKSSSI